jgi:hypothetical protein
MAAYRSLLALWTLIQRARVCVPLFVVALFSVACATEPMRAQSANDCDEVASMGSAPGYPLRLSKSTRLLRDDHHQLPLSNDVPWFGDSRQLVEMRTQKHLIAQPKPPQERSPWFGGASAQCPSNAELATAVELERQAQKAGEDAGKQYGEMLGQIEAGIQMLEEWPHNGTALQRILANPVEREAFLAGAAKDLNQVPELPTYTEQTLARAALAGFKKGYTEGVDAAHQRAFWINIGVDVYFMVIGNIAGALESAGAKVLDKAIMRLRGMPIFVPGTVEGGGFFMKRVAPVVTGSSRKLLNALLEAGKKPLEGEVPHHVVAHGDWRAEEARKILAKFDVGVDTAENGVFLPQHSEKPNPKGKAVHSTVHTNAYFEAVFGAIEHATSKQEVIAKLQEIALKLEKGGL